MSGPGELTLFTVVFRLDLGKHGKARKATAQQNAENPRSGIQNLTATLGSSDRGAGKTDLIDLASFIGGKDSILHKKAGKTVIFVLGNTHFKARKAND